MAAGSITHLHISTCCYMRHEMSWDEATKQLSQLALPNPPTVVVVDNEATCKMSLNDKLTKHTRHMSRRFHYVCQGSNQDETARHKLTGVQARTCLATLW